MTLQPTSAAVNHPLPTDAVILANERSHSLDSPRASAPGSASSSAASNGKLRKAAGEFESILLESLWKSMKETFATPDDDSDPILQSFDDWSIRAMSSAVGQAGGLGIKNMILKYLEPRIGSGSGPAGA